MIDLAGIAIGSMDNVVPGIGIIAVVIIGIIFAFKYLIVTKFDATFMNFLDRNTSVVIENIVVLTVFWFAFIFISYLLLYVDGDKMQFLAIEIVGSIIVIFSMCLYYGNKPDKKAEKRFLIEFYILSVMFISFQIVVINHLNTNITKADMIISFFFALYGLLIMKSAKLSIPSKSQCMYIDEDGQERYMHYIIRDDLVLCSDTGNLSNDNERFLIDIHNIKRIKMIRDINNMKNDDSSKNGNKPTITNNGNKRKSPNEIYADMLSIIKKNKDKTAVDLIDDCFNIIKDISRSDLIKIQAIADINYNNDNIPIMLSLVTILIAMYTFISTIGKDYGIITSLIIVAIPAVYTIGAMIWMFFETKKRRPYIIISTAIKEKEQMLNINEDI